MIQALVWGGLAASSLLIGFLFANRGLSNRTIGILMGVGAGAILSSIAYELVPISVIGGGEMALAFLLGALTFFAGDWIINQKGGSGRIAIAGNQSDGSSAAIFVGTLLDGVPESIILGMTVALGSAINVAFLAAVFISNFPEGLAGSVNMESSGFSRKKVLWMWIGLVGISAVCAGLGFIVIQVLPSADGRRAQAFAAGAMLTMLADAMMPEAFEHGGITVGLFTVLGFLAAAILSVSQ